MMQWWFDPAQQLVTVNNTGLCEIWPKLVPHWFRPQDDLTLLRMKRCAESAKGHDFRPTDDIQIVECAQCHATIRFQKLNRSLT